LPAAPWRVGARAVLSWVCACALAGCALPRQAPPAALSYPAGEAAAAVESDGYPPLIAVAPGVYVQRGADEAPTTLNQGATANIGVLIGASGVVVINTGSSAAHAEALLARIARITKLPVSLAINTQASPDQVLGNSVFTRHGIPVLAHRQTDAFMREHCTACVADVRSRADSEALAATSIAWPTLLIDGSQSLSSGGRQLQIIYFGWTEQPGSLAVLDTRSGVLFTGDMASFGVVPQTHLGQLQTWIGALREMRQMKPALVVPGHGPAGPATRLVALGTYLESLYDQTLAAYERGEGLLETVDSLNLFVYRGWALYDAYHRRNVHFAYLQIEAQDLKN